MIDNFFDIIISDTFTSQSLHRRIQLLKNYLLAKFFSDGKFPEDADEADRAWLTSFPALPTITKENISDVFTQLEEHVRKLAPLVVFVPIALPQEEIENIGKLLRKDYGGHFLIDVRIDPLLIAGAALAWKGLYKDYSLRARMKDNRQAIIAGFQKYIT